jgi:hypothetical protein
MTETCALAVHACTAAPERVGAMSAHSLYTGAHATPGSILTPPFAAEPQVDARMDVDRRSADRACTGRRGLELDQALSHGLRPDPARL